MENSTAQNITEERNINLGSKENILPIFTHEGMINHLYGLSHFIDLYIDGKLIEKFDVAFPEKLRDNEFLPQIGEYTKFKCFENKIEIFMKDGSLRTFKRLGKGYINKQGFIKFMGKIIKSLKDDLGLDLYGFHMEYFLFKNAIIDKRRIMLSASKPIGMEFKINELGNVIDALYTSKVTNQKFSLIVEVAEDESHIIVEKVMEGNIYKFYFYPLVKKKEG